jgi:hypothetical protein
MKHALRMPALPTTPRLERLTPTMVAQEVDDVLERWRALVRVEHPLDFTRRPSALAERMALLTTWAQTGRGLDAFELDEILIDAMNVFYRRPIDPTAPPIPEIDTDLYPDFREEPSDVITCVLLAALARRALHPYTPPGKPVEVPRGRVISAARLAPLASVATSRIHQLRKRFKRSAGTAIIGKDAARYLAERGVLGFLPEPIDSWGNELRNFRLGPKMSHRASATRIHQLHSEYLKLRKLTGVAPEVLDGLERLLKTHNQLATPERRVRAMRKG